MAQPLRPPSRHRGPARAGALGIGALLLAAGLWSGLWWLGSRRAAAELDAWIGVEAARGRTWTCPDRTVEGYPTAVRLRCARPTFHGEVAGRLASGTLAGLRAGVDALHPRSVRVELDGPLVLRADEDEGFKLVASWDGLRVTAGSLPGPFASGALDARHLAVTLSPTPGDDLNLRADHLAGAAEPSGAAGGAAWRFAAAGVSFPTLDALTGTPDLFAAEGSGVLDRADLLSAPTAARLDAWRRAGGRLRVAALTLGKGSFSGQAAGVLALDDAHRAAGTLDASFQGYGPLAKRFGIPLAGVQLGGLLSSLLGGGKPAPAPTTPDTVRLQLTLADGRVAVGPVRMPVRLDPFY